MSKTLPQWLHWLEQLHPRSIDMGLERVSQVAERLDIPRRLAQHRSRVITVAGTNGKGSCVATLESLALAGKASVGAYTSPHLLRYNERIRLNGLEASDRDIIHAFEAIEAQRREVSLTYFEFGTLAALYLFTQSALDFVLLEVGLGGRLDAVNIVDPSVAIVTSVALDHQRWLGDDRDTIGREKAGIFRPGVPAICADGEPPPSVSAVARQLGAPLYRIGRDFGFEGKGFERNGFEGNGLQTAATTWCWHGQSADGEPVSYAGLTKPALPPASVAAAIQAMALLAFPLSHDLIEQSLQDLHLAGRCQRVDRAGRSLLLDVAHNPAAADYLAGVLAGTPAAGGGKTLAVFAVLEDKDIDAILDRMTDAIDYWLVSGLPGVERAASAALLEQKCRDRGFAVETCDTVATALTKGLAMASETDRLVVFGSFYTVAAALESLQTE